MFNAKYMKIKLHFVIDDYDFISDSKKKIIV